MKYITLQDVILCEFETINNTEILRFPDFIEYLQKHYPFHYKIIQLIYSYNNNKKIENIDLQNIQEFDQLFNIQNLPEYQNVFEQLKKDFQRNTIKYYSFERVIICEQSYLEFVKVCTRFTRKFSDFKFDFTNFKLTDQKDYIYRKDDTITFRKWKYISEFFTNIESCINEIPKIVSDYYDQILIPKYLNKSIQVFKDIFDKNFEDHRVLCRVYKRLNILNDYWIFYINKDSIRSYTYNFWLNKSRLSWNQIKEILQSTNLERCTDIKGIIKEIISYNFDLEGLKVDDLYQGFHSLDTSNKHYQQDIGKHYFDNIIDLIKESLHIFTTCDLDIENLFYNSLEVEELSSLHVSQITKYYSSRQGNYLSSFIYSFIEDFDNIQNNQIFKLYSKSVQEHLLNYPDTISILCIFLTKLVSILEFLRRYK